MRKKYLLLATLGTFIWNNNSYGASVALSYDSDTEYSLHKEVTKEYFSGKSKNSKIKTTLETLQKELVDKKPLSEIPLDNMSSRRRIMLIKQITSLIAENVCEDDYFMNELYEGYVMRKSKFPVTFSLAFKDKTGNSKNKLIKLTHQYSKTQPGNAQITFDDRPPIKYCKFRQELLAGLDVPKKITSVEFQKLVAKRLAKDRNSNSPDNSGSVAEINFLLDFEVARRLTGIDKPKELAELEKKAEQIILFLDWCGDMGKEGESSAAAAEISEAEKSLEYLEKQIEELKITLSASRKPAGFDATNYDEIPVAASIVAMLKLGKDGTTVPLEKFFAKGGEYDGLIIRDPDARRRGVRKAIRALRGGDQA
jgi:hypothetical protein